MARIARFRCTLGLGTHMNAVNMTWGTETGRLACRWGEVGQRIGYDAPWLREASKETRRNGGAMAAPDFTGMSPFGAGLQVLNATCGRRSATHR